MRWFLSLTLLGLSCWAAADAFQDEGRPSMDGAGAFLIQGLKSTKGCLGVETAATSSGKSVIFAWFSGKEAALRWYHSNTHQTAMHQFMDVPEDQLSEPLAHVADDVGPILCIASLTPTPTGDQGVPGVRMPISQIAIELYTPLPGGTAVGGRFAPDAVKVPHLRAHDLVPQKRDAQD